mgnify:CR=1 FL=1
MKYVIRIINWLSSLKVAIFILILIAIASAIGTSLPQKAPIEDYITRYESQKLFGIFNGQSIVNLQLNHVYSSSWFLALLAWLSISLIICSWKRQWPSLQKAIGMGYVQKAFTKSDTEIYIQVRKKSLKAKVVKLPFYKG